MRRYIFTAVTIMVGLAGAVALAQFGGGGFSGPGATLRGPTSSTDNAIVRFNGTTGKRVQNSGIVIDDSDRMTNSSQPCFLAFNSVTDVDQTGNNTFATVDFNIEVFDQGADFAADTFTAPVTGRYLLTTVIQVLGITTAADAILTEIVTSNRTYRGTRFDLTNGLPDRYGMTLSVVADMDSSDTATVRVLVNGEGSSVVDVVGDATILLTTFSGCLLS